eukprot:TRINITY_DN16708_c0_g1_i2.p1 TRINITY_DN16708_c0_g1~~TRINITY_DN16708_c0_g1_i2.p1  ORF type:complete len:346 (+),score=69.52 TRINITY_DN16708_c0_g1_i2:204-1241(+)
MIPGGNPFGAKSSANDDNQALAWKVKVKIFFTFFWSLLGILIGGYGGWLYSTGPPVLVGCAVGWLVALVAAAWGTGLIQHWIDRTAFRLHPPEVQRVLTTGMQTWELFITIHRVQDAFNGEQFNLFTSAHQQWMFVAYRVEVKEVMALSYDNANIPVHTPHVVHLRLCNFQVEVGRVVRNDYFSVAINKPMRTCAQQSGTYEETFKAMISPTDNTIRLTLFVQGVTGDKVLGICDINITDQVLNAAFPQKRVYNLLHRAKDDSITNTDQFGGGCVVSFTPGSDMSEGAVAALEKKNTIAFAHMRSLYDPRNDPTMQASGAYGAWATSTGFNTAGNQLPPYGTMGP